MSRTCLGAVVPLNGFLWFRTQTHKVPGNLECFTAMLNDIRHSLPTSKMVRFTLDFPLPSTISSPVSQSQLVTGPNETFEFGRCSAGWLLGWKTTQLFSYMIWYTSPGKLAWQWKISNHLSRCISYWQINRNPYSISLTNSQNLNKQIEQMKQQQQQIPIQTNQK